MRFKLFKYREPTVKIFKIAYGTLNKTNNILHYVNHVPAYNKK